MQVHATGRALLLVLLVAALAFAPTAGSQSAQGSGQYRVQPFTDLQTTKGSIPPMSAFPTKEAPGAIAFDAVEHFEFNGRWTNTKHAVTLEVVAASGSDAGPTQTIQGTVHQIADWVRIRQDGAPVFGTVTATGVFDADAAAYIEPVGGFDKTSQGTVTIQTYPVDAPEDGQVEQVLYWIYDGGRDRFWFDAVDSDFTNNNGEVRIYPIATTNKPKYTFELEGLSYGVAAVADAGQQHVPTVRLTWEKVPGVANGHDFSAYVLFDFPPGTLSDAYDFEVQATIHSLQ